jgi:plasmid stability protein
MPVNLSIKNAPDDVVERLRQRAESNHRSLQGELLAIIEAAVRQDVKRTPADILATVRALGVHSDDGSTDIIRAARDGRQGR